MRVDVIGLGCGEYGAWAQPARGLLEQADLVIGAQRLLDTLPPRCGRTEAEYRPDRIAELLNLSEAAQAAVVLSGDSGFYSGAARLVPLLEQQGYEVQVHPGLSSVQMLAAALRRPWQDWRLCSAHGVDCDPVEQVCYGRPAFFLTGGAVTPGTLCQMLEDADLGDLEASVGERLGYPDQRVVTDRVYALARQSFDPLSVLLVEPAPLCPPRVPGIPDGEWIRDKVPMTKQEVRAAALAKLAVRETDCCWDIGAGTGSVGIELALHCRQCWAVEENPAARDLILVNRRKFCAWKLRPVFGRAPEVLANLPAPDAVFIGGSKGELSSILDVILGKNPHIRVCVSAVTVETLTRAVQVLEQAGLEAEITEIAVSRSQPAGSYHLMKAQNPVFLIFGGT